MHYRLYLLVQPLIGFILSDLVGQVAVEMYLNRKKWIAIIYELNLEVFMAGSYTENCFIASEFYGFRSFSNDHGVSILGHSCQIGHYCSKAITYGTYRGTNSVIR